MPNQKTNTLYGVFALIAALLVVGGVALFYVAYRGIQLLKQEAAHAMTVAGGDAGAMVGKGDYVGRWTGGGVSTSISPRGGIDYATKSKGDSEEFHGSVSFDGTDMVIDALVMKKRVHIDKPPHEDGSRWRMTLDGVELEKE